MDSFSIVRYIHEEFGGGKRYIRIIDVADLQDLWLAIRVTRHRVELDGHVVGRETHARNLGLRERVQARLDRLQALVEEAGLVGLNAAVQHENVRRLQCLANAEVRWSFDIVGPTEEFRSSFTVQPFSKLISSAEIA